MMPGNKRSISLSQPSYRLYSFCKRDNLKKHINKDLILKMKDPFWVWHNCIIGTIIFRLQNDFDVTSEYEFVILGHWGSFLFSVWFTNSYFPFMTYKALDITRENTVVKP